MGNISIKFSNGEHHHYSHAVHSDLEIYEEFDRYIEANHKPCSLFRTSEDANSYEVRDPTEADYFPGPALSDDNIEKMVQASSLTRH